MISYSGVLTPSHHSFYSLMHWGGGNMEKSSLKLIFSHIWGLTSHSLGQASSRWGRWPREQSREPAKVSSRSWRSRPESQHLTILKKSSYTWTVMINSTCGLKEPTYDASQGSLTRSNQLHPHHKASCLYSSNSKACESSCYDEGEELRSKSCQESTSDHQRVWYQECWLPSNLISENSKHEATDQISRHGRRSDAGSETLPLTNQVPVWCYRVTNLVTGVYFSFSGFEKNFDISIKFDKISTKHKGFVIKWLFFF